MRSEASVQQQIRLQAARDGVMLWRNNSGALTDQQGRLIRFGLGNDSPEINRKYKSGDLVGIVPTLIMPHHVGQTFGRFAVVEVKEEGWVFLPGRDDRADAQDNFNGAVRAYGGVAGFAASVEQAQEIWLPR